MAVMPLAIKAIIKKMSNPLIVSRCIFPF
jgi:hypothetical protein